MCLLYRFRCGSVSKNRSNYWSLRRIAPPRSGLTSLGPPVSSSIRCKPNINHNHSVIRRRPAMKNSDTDANNALGNRAGSASSKSKLLEKGDFDLLQPPTHRLTFQQPQLKKLQKQLKSQQPNSTLLSSSQLNSARSTANCVRRRRRRSNGKGGGRRDSSSALSSLKGEGLATCLSLEAVIPPPIDFEGPNNPFSIFDSVQTLEDIDHRNPSSEAGSGQRRTWSRRFFSPSRSRRRALQQQPPELMDCSGPVSKALDDEDDDDLDPAEEKPPPQLDLFQPPPPTTSSSLAALCPSGGPRLGTTTLAFASRHNYRGDRSFGTSYQHLRRFQPALAGSKHRDSSKPSTTLPEGPWKIGEGGRFRISARRLTLDGDVQYLLEWGGVDFFGPSKATVPTLSSLSAVHDDQQQKPEPLGAETSTTAASSETDSTSATSKSQFSSRTTSVLASVGAQQQPQRVPLPCGRPIRPSSSSEGLLMVTANSKSASLFLAPTTARIKLSSSSD